MELFQKERLKPLFISEQAKVPRENLSLFLQEVVPVETEFIPKRETRLNRPYLMSWLQGDHRGYWLPGPDPKPTTRVRFSTEQPRVYTYESLAFDPQIKQMWPQMTEQQQKESGFIHLTKKYDPNQLLLEQPATQKPQEALYMPFMRDPRFKVPKRISEDLYQQPEYSREPEPGLGWRQMRGGFVWPAAETVEAVRDSGVRDSG